MSFLSKRIAVITGAVIVIGSVFILYQLSKSKSKNKVHSSNTASTNTIDDDDTQKADDKSLKPKTDNFGFAQSPINIMITDADNKNTKIIKMKNSDFHSSALKILYPSSVKNCTILNNGHTVQVNIASENECILIVNNRKYLLKQFHFHTPSEHLINSKQYEMEMHLVHSDNDGNLAVLGLVFTTKQKHLKPVLKLSKSRRSLELIVKSKSNSNSKLKSKSKLKTLSDDVISDSDDSDFDTDDDYESDGDDGNDGDIDQKDVDVTPTNVKNDKNEVNDFLDQFWDKLPLNKTTDDILLNIELSFDYLFETAASNFHKNIKTNEINVNMELFEYMGSLTTPPFTEGVQWLVSKTTHFISQKQLNKLSSCWGNKSNARDVQQHFGRTISLRQNVALKGV